MVIITFNQTIIFYSKKRIQNVAFSGISIFIQRKLKRKFNIPGIQDISPPKT
jgi:hypothetical protein